MNGIKEAIIGGAYIIASMICFLAFSLMLSTTRINNIFYFLPYWGGIPAILGLLGIFFLVLGSIFIIVSVKK